MPGNEASHFLRRFRALVAGHVSEDLPDQHLLERFATQRDESAFVALLARHGSMVLGVCRRALHDEYLAEDVFQATFLILARNAGSIHHRPSVGSWLHGVALRLARKARAQAAALGQRAARPGPTPSPNPVAEASGREVRPILDEELQRLPERYRLPLVLCYLEGQSRDEAAAQLGWKPGRVKGLLERGRERLRSRLIRRGLTLAAAGAALQADPVRAVPVPPWLAAATGQAARCLVAGDGLAACGISVSVHQLIEERVPIVGAKKLAMVLGLALVVGAAGLGAGLLAQRTDGSATPAAREPSPSPPVPAAAPIDEKRPRTAGGVPKPEAVWREKASFKEGRGQTWQPGGLFPAFVRFSPDGTRLATACGATYSGSSYALLDLATGKDLTDRGVCSEDGRIVSPFLGFGPDGRAWGLQWVKVGGSVFARYRNVVDWVSGRERARVSFGRDKGIQRAALSPDGKVMAIANGGNVKLWDMATGKELGALAGHPKGEVELLAFSPNGKTLATAGNRPLLFGIHGPDPDVSADIRLWNVATRREGGGLPLKGRGLKVQRPGEDPTKWMRFTPDGKRLAIACHVVLPGQPYSQVVLRFWDAAGLRERGQIDSKEFGSLRDFAFSPDGQTVALAWIGATVEQGAGKTTVYAPAPVTILDVASAKEVARIGPPRSGFAALAFSANGKLLATQDNEGIVEVWARTAAK